MPFMMKKIGQSVCAWTVLYSGTFACAAPTCLPICPGNYTREIVTGNNTRVGDTGNLHIAKDSSGQMLFEIDSIGANGHMCAVSGVIRGRTGYADTPEGKNACKILLKSVSPHLIDVEVMTWDTCRGFCGARAVLDGTYKAVTPRCTDKSQRARRDTFLRLYKAHRYSEAAEKLSGLLQECSAFVNWVEIDRIRNDLALAQYHSGDAHACVETLSQTMASASTNEDDLALAPYDRDVYLDVAKATWHNKRLCEKALAKGH